MADILYQPGVPGGGTLTTQIGAAPQFGGGAPAGFDMSWLAQLAARKAAREDQDRRMAMQQMKRQNRIEDYQMEVGAQDRFRKQTQEDMAKRDAVHQQARADMPIPMNYESRGFGDWHLKPDMEAMTDPYQRERYVGTLGKGSAGSVSPNDKEPPPGGGSPAGEGVRSTEAAAASTNAAANAAADADRLRRAQWEAHEQQRLSADLRARQAQELMASGGGGAVSGGGEG